MTPQDPPPTLPGPAPEAPPPPRRVTRSSGDRMVAGVAGGLAHHFDLDPALVRVAFVVLSLVGGAGVALYAIFWLLLPSDHGPAPIGPEASTTRKWVLAIVVAVAVLSLPFTGAGFFFAGPALLFVAVIGALGVLLWRAAGGRGDASLTRAALLILAVAGSLLLGLGAGVAAAFGGGVVVAGLVVVAGIALVIAGFRGGARWLVIPALLMAIPLAVVAAADIDLTGGIGEREYRPSSVTEIDDAYRLGVGRLELDLSDVDFPASGVTDVDLEVGVGRVELRVPQDVCVQLRTRVGLGEVVAFDRVNNGVDIAVERRPAPVSDRAVLAVDADAGMGRIEIGHDGFTDEQPACRT